MDWIITGFGDEIADSLDEQLRVMAQCGVRHIDVRNVDGKVVTALTRQEAQAAAKKIRQAGFSVPCLGSPCGKIDVTGDLEAHLKQFDYALWLCQLFEAPRMRMFSFRIPKGQSAAPYRDAVLRRLEAMLERARGSGVTLCHENEKGIYGDVASRCLDLARTFGADLPLIFDPSNFIQCGENVLQAYETLRPYVSYLHVKDALYEKDPPDGKGQVRPAGQGAADFPALMQRLAQDGKTQYLCIEHHLRLPCWGETGADRFRTAYEAIARLAGAAC